MPSELVAAIEACPRPPESLTFLTTERGRPFTKDHFGDTFRAWVAEAGLPRHCTPHGLRKGGCRVMAESLCNPFEIMAVSGHRTLKEVVKYTEAFDRKRLAAQARAKVAGAAQVQPEATGTVASLAAARAAKR